MVARRRHRGQPPHLHDLISDQVAANPGLDAFTIAKRVADRIPHDRLQITLALAVVGKVKGEIARRLAKYTRTEYGERVKPGPADNAVDVLQFSVCTRPGEWKALGECSADDLRAMSAFRLGIVDQQAAMARRLRELADEIESRDVGRVFDVPLAEVERLLQGDPRAALRVSTAEGAP